jgi:hypothetical protein
MGTHRPGPHPIARELWDQGPPSRAMLLDESRWPHPDGWQGRATWQEIQHARYLLWWLTATDDDEQVPTRLRSYDSGPSQTSKARSP